MRLLKWFVKKERIVVIDKNSNVLLDYDSMLTPSIGEFIYDEKNELYYRVINVIHAVRDYKSDVTVVVEINNILK